MGDEHAEWMKEAAEEINGIVLGKLSVEKFNKMVQTSFKKDALAIIAKHAPACGSKPEPSQYPDWKRLRLTAWENRAIAAEAELEELKKSLRKPEPTEPIPGRWRLGSKVPLNVYDGSGNPVCQCHRAVDAEAIVCAVNAARQAPEVPEGGQLKQKILRAAAKFPADQMRGNLEDGPGVPTQKGEKS